MLTPDDITAIHEVLARYCHVVDDHLWDRAHEVFTNDVTIDLSEFGQPDLHGIDDIVATFRGRNAYAHHTTDIAVTEEVDGTVRVHSKSLAFPNEGPVATGDNHDIVVRTDRGWRIASRRPVPRQRQFFD